MGLDITRLVGKKTIENLIMNIYIIIPAYNEDKTIGGVISGIRSNYPDYKVVVVDDGSNDNTYQQTLAAGVKVLSHLINRGQGAAIGTGIKYALAKGAEIIITFDADGQHQVADLSKIIRPIIENQAAVVLGSRFLSGTNQIPLLRKIILKLGVIFTRIISGVKLTDAHNGLRAFGRKAAERINITQDRMAHSSEIIEEIKKNKLNFIEVPVTVNYTKYSLQKGQTAFDSLKIVKDILIKKITK